MTFLIPIDHSYFNGALTILKVLLLLVTIFIPPVGVFLVSGCGPDLLINICLTLLGYVIPISFIVISKTPIDQSTDTSQGTFTHSTSNMCIMNDEKQPEKEDFKLPELPESIPIGCKVEVTVRSLSLRIRWDISELLALCCSPRSEMN